MSHQIKTRIADSFVSEKTLNEEDIKLFKNNFKNYKYFDGMIL